MGNVVAPTIGASLAGVGFLVLMGVGLIKSGSSIQQMRWVFALSALLTLAVGYGAIALNQGYVDRPDDDTESGTHSVLWGVPLMHAITVPLGVLVLTLGLFESLGARILPAVIALFSFGALTLGVFNDDFGKWYWYIVAVALYAVFILAVLFVDRLDRLARAVRGKAGAKEELTEGWNGLPWRIGHAALLGVYYLIYALDFPVSAVIPNYLWSLIIWVILDVVAAVIVFLIWWFVQPVEYNPAAPISNVAATFAGAQAQSGAAYGDAQPAQRRKQVNGAGGYTVLNQ